MQWWSKIIFQRGTWLFIFQAVLYYYLAEVYNKSEEVVISSRDCDLVRCSVIKGSIFIHHFFTRDGVILVRRVELFGVHVLWAFVRRNRGRSRRWNRDRSRRWNRRDSWKIIVKMVKKDKTDCFWEMLSMITVKTEKEVPNYNKRSIILNKKCNVYE